MKDEVKLGFVGLGQMGARIAKRMVAWPGGVSVFDVSSDAMKRLADTGASLADSVAEVASADIIGIAVLDDAQVREVITGRDGLAANARAGTIIAIHSTISDATAVELANKLQPQGIHVIDAPVSGGVPAAKEGELATMVGADDDVFNRIYEPFSLWASLIVHAGPPGAGTRMKLARNMLHFTSFAAVAEAQRLAEASGLNLQDLGRLVRHTDSLTGGPGAVIIRDKTGELTPEDDIYESMSGIRIEGEHDLAQTLELARSYSIDVPLAAAALENLASGLGVPNRGKKH